MTQRDEGDSLWCVMDTPYPGRVRELCEAAGVQFDSTLYVLASDEEDALETARGMVTFDFHSPLALPVQMR